MAMDRRSWIAVALLAVTTLAACPNGHQRPDESVTAYFQMRQAFGDALGRGVAKEQGPIYRIVAITGPQYPVGSALDPQNPADVVAPACVLPEPELVSWVPFPETSSESFVQFGATFPSLVQRALPTLANLGISVSATSTVRWSMKDVSQRLAPQSVFQRAISSGACRAETAGRDVLFVRGVIYSREIIKSARSLNLNASATTVGNGIKITTDTNKEFSIEDRAVMPRYHILTFKGAENNDRGVPLRSIELIRPQDTLLNKF